MTDEIFEAEFMTWWEEHGQYCRTGGGDYERTFAFEAWRHLYPKLLQARATLSSAHIEDEREACERWIRQQIGMPSHIAMDWEAPLARYAWLAWKARAALSAPPAAGVPGHAEFLEWAERVLDAEQERLSAEDYLMDSEDCIKVLREAAAPTPPASEQQRAVVMPEITGTAIVEVVSGVEGPSLYIGDGSTGYRLAGPKPWGGGKTIHKFRVKLDELVSEAMDLATPPQENDR